MRTGSVLITPWRASRPLFACMLLGFFALCFLAALALVGFKHGAHPVLVSAGVAGESLAFLATFLLAGPVLLGAEAYQLRLPGVAATVAASFACHLLLIVLLPALIWHAFGLPLLACLVWFALWTLGGLLYALWPAYLSMLLVFAFLLRVFLHDSAEAWLLPPGVDSPFYLRWAAPTLIALTGLLLWRWRQIARDTPFARGSHRPLIAGLRGKPARPAAAGMTQHAPDWLRLGFDLRRCGPAFPVRSLRVALGGVFRPLRIGSRLLLALSVTAVMAVMAVAGWLAVITGDARADVLLLSLTAAALSILGVPVIATSALQHHWSRPNAQLALLPLLPGLGSGTVLKRHVLRAVLLLPLCWMLGSALLTLGLLAWAQVALPIAAVLLFAMLSLGLGILVASTIGTLGGSLRPLGVRIVAAMLPLFAGLLCCIGGALAASGDTAVAVMLPRIVLALWLPSMLACAWLGRRGIRALRARAHPFLLD